MDTTLNILHECRFLTGLSGTCRTEQYDVTPCVTLLDSLHERIDGTVNPVMPVCRARCAFPFKSYPRLLPALYVSLVKRTGPLGFACKPSRIVPQ